jgi:ribosomal protein S18 acetylase RimI-like enzyme
MLRSVPITENFTDIAKVEALAAEAFPPAEYLAPSRMIEMAKSGGFDFWALYDGDIFVGFMTVMTYKSLAYLFFLAVDKTQRSKGCGTKAIELLRALYPDRQHIVDMEMPDENAQNKLQREKRRRFYMRNGYKVTGQYLSYLGVNYEVLCADDRFDFELFRELMKQIKVDGFAPVYFR